MCETTLKSAENSINDSSDDIHIRQNDTNRMNGNGIASGGSIDDLSSVSRERRAEIRFNRAKHIGSLEPGDCGSSPLIKPEWYNEELFKAAQRLAKERFCSLFFGHLCGLCMLVHIPSILTTLMGTNNSKTVADAFTRYLGTLTHVKAWYEGDIWNISDPAYKSILAVRRMHERVASKMNASKVRGQDVLFISQYDMFLTQFGFIGMLILHPKECGLPENGHEEQLKCLIHFWRCIGYMLGIEDRFNMCHDEADLDGIRCLCATIMDREFRPLISKYSSEESRVMSRSIVEAIKAFIPPLSVTGFTKYLYKMNMIESPVKVTGIQKAGYHGINLTMKHILPQARLSFIFDRLLRRAIRRAHKKQEIIKQRLTSKDIIIVESNLTTDV